MLSQLFALLRQNPRARQSLRRHKLQGARRRYLETLEPRQLLASVPVAVNDPFYTTPLNTNLTVSGGSAVLANDFQVDSHTLTASVVTNPAHGTLTSFTSSTGAFTYTPTTGYVGYDTFTYQASDSGTLSNVATVTIAVGGTFGPRTNLDENPLSAPQMTGVNKVTRDLSLGEQLVYSSDTSSLKPIVVVETSLLATSAVPNTIDAVLTFGGVTNSTVSYNNTGLAAGDTLRFALQADASSLATGYYDWTLTLTANFTGSTTTTTFTGSQAVVNRTASEFGKGWWLQGLDQIVSSGSGALLVRGNGDALWFKANGGSYDPAAGDTSFATLVKNGNNTFTLTTKHGIEQNFSTTGLLTSVVDPSGNTIAYAYTDADSDSVTDEIYTITDPYSRVQTFGYTSGKVTSYTDYASHAITLAHTSGKLTSVTLTDPDGGGALAAPVWSFSYNGTTNLLATMTNPLSKPTNYTYNSTSQRLSGIDYYYNGEGIQMTPVQTIGLKTGTGNTPYKTVRPYGSYTDELIHTFYFQTDRFGNITSNYYSGDTTDTYRDAKGLPYKILQPNAGSGRPQTLNGYNASGDLLKQITPETTSLSWTYDSTFHKVLTATDEMGRTTTWTYNGDGNELTRTDAGGNVWSTSYTGNSHGLPTSVTSPDPDGAGGLSAYVTGYAYDSYGRLETTTNPDSTTTDLAYNSANLVTSSTDELGNETTFAYDALNRLTSVTGEDPDGAGAQSAPVTSFVYDALGLKSSETDPLGNETSYDYDFRGRMLHKTQEDPDGAGPLDAPVSTLSYFGTGWLDSLGIPLFNGDTSYTYDVYGRKLEETGPTVNSEFKHDEWMYDVLGRTTSYENSLGQVDTFTYNQRGWRLTKRGHDPDSTGPLVGPLFSTAYNYAGQVTSETDPLGNVTQYTYTTAGWLEKIIAPDPDGSGVGYGPIVTYGYDALGRRTSVTDPLNRVSSTTYDWRGNVLTETGVDPDGAGGASAPVTTYDYDDAGNLLSVTDPLGYVTTYAYDGLNRKLSMTLPDPDGAGALSAPVYAYGYDLVGNLTSETDPLGNVTTTAYDNLYRKISVTGADPDGAGALSAPVTTWEYGDNGQVETVTDPLGRETTYGYDGYGRQTSVTNNQGKVSATSYNLLDQVTHVNTPDPDGAGSLSASYTNSTYDYLNRLSTTVDSSGTTTYTYDAASRLLTLDDPLANTTTYAYDNLGRVTLETNELNKTKSLWYDQAGNLTRVKDRLNRVTQYGYDDLNRQTTEKWLTSGDPTPTVTIATTTQGGPINEVQRVGYSASFFLSGGTFTLSFGGNTTSAINYDASAATVQTALEGLASIGSGNVSVAKTTNTSLAKTWTVTFQGSLGGTNQAQMTINTGSVSGYTLSNVQATDTNGAATGSNEVQTITLANSTAGSFRIGFDGQTTAAIAYNASAGTVESTLEALQAIDNVTVTGSGPWTVTFGGTQAGINVAQMQADGANLQSGSVARTITTTYDANNQVTAVSDSDSSYAYTYDHLGRVLTISNSGTSGVPTVVFANTYDAASQRTKVTTTVGGTADYENDYSYDNLLRLTRIDQIGQSGGSTVADKRVDLAYNANSQFDTLTRKYKSSGTWTEAATTAFSYDTLNRVSGIDHKRSGSSLFTAYAYSYDYADRITGITSQDGTVAHTYSQSSQITGADYSYQTDETFGWDANGNRNTSGYTVSTNNRITADGTYTYTFDDEGNLTRRTKTSDSSVRDFTWDQRNRLTSVVDRVSAGGTITMQADYKYDVFNRRISKVVDADGAGAGAAVTQRFVFDGDATNVALQFDGSSTLTRRYLWNEAVDQILASEDASHAILWSLTDHLGTVRDLYNNTGTSQNHLKYDAFGAVTSESASAVDFLMGFAGTVRDEETGNNYAWHRYAKDGRWLSEDPEGFDAGDPNLRRYSGNDPVGSFDPDGLQEKPVYGPHVERLPPIGSNDGPPKPSQISVPSPIEPLAPIPPMNYVKIQNPDGSYTIYADGKPVKEIPPKSPLSFDAISNLKKEWEQWQKSGNQVTSGPFPVLPQIKDNSAVFGVANPRFGNVEIGVGMAKLPSVSDVFKEGFRPEITFSLGGGSVVGTPPGFDPLAAGPSTVFTPSQVLAAVGKQFEDWGIKAGIAHFTGEDMPKPPPLLAPMTYGTKEHYDAFPELYPKTGSPYLPPK